VITAQAKKGAEVTGTLKPKFGWLDISSDPAGVDVVVAGDKVGTTPVSSREVDTGLVEVVVDTRCFLRAGERVRIEPGQRRSVQLKLAPRTAGLRVDADAGGDDGGAREAVVTPAEDSVVDALVRAAGSSEARNTAMSGRHQASLSRRCRRWTSLTTHDVPRRQAFVVLSGSLPFGALRSIAGARPAVAS